MMSFSGSKTRKESVDPTQAPTQTFFDFVNMNGIKPLTELSAKEAWGAMNVSREDLVRPSNPKPSELELLKKEQSNTDLKTSELPIDLDDCPGGGKASVKDSTLSITIGKVERGTPTLSGGLVRDKLCRLTVSVRVPANHSLKIMPSAEMTLPVRIKVAPKSTTFITQTLTLSDIYGDAPDYEDENLTFLAQISDSLEENMKLAPSIFGTKKLLSKCYSEDSIARIDLNVHSQFTGVDHNKPMQRQFEMGEHKFGASLEYVPCAS
ncbi:MAG: hypothetical protein EOP04_06000 [Proteobacteria bacterium]|nr:MAG: hypothetical protein EOP04_06000 [Pseudomonadota bacterium]